MNIDEAYHEMKKRGWGFSWNFNAWIIAIGPLRDGLVEVIASGSSPIETLKEAIRISDEPEGKDAA